MSTEKIREEFNKWYDGARKRSAPFSTVNIRDKCFEAWKASRAAIEVELPETDQFIDYPGYISRSDTEYALESIGLKVKA